MSYWSYINTEMQVNIGTVPEGLSEDNSVAIVILGFALNSDGTMKPELIGRLETGLAIAEAYPNSYVVVTGGGTAANNPNVTEGGLMGAWLQEQGLSEDRLIIENKAPNTVGNAENTYKILAEEYPQVDSFVMVTSDYHVPRGCILFYSKCLLAAYEAGGEPLELISNAGYYTGSNGYESISLQASGVASVAGVSASNPKLSSLIKLTVSYNGELAVEAGYDSDYSRDVTEKAEITGFDPELGAEQTVTVSYTENGITMGGEFNLSEGKKDFFSVAHLENLIATAKATSPATYTRDSYAALTAAIEEAEALLDSGSYTLAEVDEAYAALNTAIAGLKPLVNVALKMNVTANCNQSNAQKVTDGTISTSNYWAGQNGSTNVPANQSELVIDLNGTYDLEAVRVYPYYNGQRIYQYELFGSVDGESWEKIGENVSEEYITSNGITHEVDATAAYIKLVGIKTKVVGRDDINNLHIIEIQAFGTEVDNLAYGKPVTSSGSDQSAASSAGAAETKVNDGDPSSYWDAGKYENSPWVIVDLQGLYDLDKLNIITYWKSSSGRYYHYDLYTSVDGQEWVKVSAKEHNTPETIFGETFDLSGQGIRAAYVKLVGVYNSANSAFHVNEIRVYGTEAHIHSYKPVVTDPTCTEDGYTTYTCDCGDSYTDVIEATGHNWSGSVCVNCGFSNVPSGLVYQLYEDHVEITGYTGDAAELVIPAVIEGKPVTSIGGLAFVNCRLTSITIPEGVTSIGRWAFYYSTSLRSIELPDSVKTIGECAFRDCTGLTSIELPDGIKTIDTAAFRGCTGLTSIVLPDSLTSIGASAFLGCTKLTSIELPDSLTSIGGGLFEGCKGLTSVKLPSRITDILNGFFQNCTSLTSIYFIGDAPRFDFMVFNRITATVYYPAGNATWTEAVMQNYHGNITWVPYGSHTHEYESVVTDPTCTEDGYTTYTCACGDTYVADQVAAKGHNDGEVVVENKVDVTCTTNGSYDEVIYCTVCGEEISRVTVTVEAQGHSFEIVDGVMTCVCGEKFEGIYNDYLYVKGVMQLRYQLVELNGDFYFVNDDNKIAKNGKLYLSEKFVEGKTFADGTAIPAGLYEFDADGKMIIPEYTVNGVSDGYLYINGMKQTRYHLVEFDGNFYFINDGDKVAKNGKLYLSEQFVEGKKFSDGRDIQPGYYEFDADGKMIVPDAEKNGVIDGYLFINGVKQTRYHLVEFEGDFYFINDGDKVAMNGKLYLSEKFVAGTTIPAGLYEFDAEGKMIIE